MKLEQIQNALLILAKSQQHTAPTKLQIGYTSESGMVQSDAIVLFDACPEAVTQLCLAGFTVSAGFGGILVDRI